MSDSNSPSNRKKIGAGSLALLVGAGSLFATTPAFAAPGDVVNLDTALQSCINQVLGNALGTDVTEGDLASLTGTLTCNSTYDDSTISSLDGIEFATSLTGVNFESQNISDLGPLAGLTGLQSVTVSNNPLTSIAPLSGLSNVNVFYGSSLPDVADWDTLEDLTNLEQLIIANSDLTDVSFVSSLTNLKDISFNSNANLQVLNPINGLTDLEKLSINNTGITEFGGIVDLPNLYSVDADNLNISDFTGLTTLVGLEELSLTGVSSSVWDQLGGITVPLIFLSLDQTLINDYSWTDGMTIEALASYNSGISDLSQISGIQGLKILDVESSNISDVSPLAGMTDLLSLYIDDNQIADLSPIKDLNIATLSAANQIVNAGATVGQPYGNPIIKLNGDAVEFIEPEYSAADNTFTFDSTGAFANNWAVNETSTAGTIYSFSGTLNIQVVEDSATLPVVTNVTVTPGSNPTNTANVTFDQAEEAEMYFVEFEPQNLGGTTVTSTFTPEQVAAGNLSVEGLSPNLEYAVTVNYITANGVEAPSSAPVSYTTAAETSDKAPQLVNVQAVSEKDNTIEITFNSVASIGGTQGNGDVTQFRVQYKLQGTNEWKELIAEGTEDSTNLTIVNIDKGKYDLRVSYITSTDVESDAVEVNDVTVAGVTTGGNGNAAPANTPKANSSNLNNTSSEADMTQLGLLAGGGLLLAASGAMFAASRKSKQA